jgi:hypothetical protein
MKHSQDYKDPNGVSEFFFNDQSPQSMGGVDVVGRMREIWNVPPHKGKRKTGESFVEGTSTVRKIQVREIYNPVVTGMFGARTTASSDEWHIITDTEGASLKKKRAQIRVSRELIEHNVFVDLPPIDKWTVRVRIKEISDAKPFKIKPD